MLIADIAMFRNLFLSVFLLWTVMVQAQDLNNPAYGPTLQQRQMQEWSTGHQRNLVLPEGYDENYWRDQEYFAAIAVKRHGGGRVGWSAGFRNRQYVQLQALKACGDDCKVIKLFSNTCGMISEPKGNKDLSNISFGSDRDPERAIDKAYAACESIHGKGNCRYSQRDKAAKHTAFCTGYEYGVYSRQ